LATTVSGNTTSVAVNQDVRIQGSNVVSSQGTQVLTGRDLSIEAATDTRHETHAYIEKQSGLFSGGGFSITIGTQQKKTDQVSKRPSITYLNQSRSTARTITE
jgi:filamentous hemagglutinin